MPDPVSYLLPVKTRRDRRSLLDIFHFINLGGSAAAAGVDRPSRDQRDSPPRPGEFVCFDLGQVVT